VKDLLLQIAAANGIAGCCPWQSAFGSDTQRDSDVRATITPGADIPPSTNLEPTI